MNFLHIGGGSGDLDPATNYRDGFSEFVKKHKSKNKNSIWWFFKVIYFWRWSFG